MPALGLGDRKSLSYPGGVARSGVFGTIAKMVKVDVPSPTDKCIKHRADVVIRLQEEAIIDILEVGGGCAEERDSKEAEIPGTGS